MQVKVHRAKRTNAPTIEIWGTGTPKREFLLVADLADALVFMMKRYSAEPHLNVGTGADITIRELAELAAKVAGWKGEFTYDRSKPDGMPRKVMDVSKLARARVEGEDAARGRLSLPTTGTSRTPRASSRPVSGGPARSGIAEVSQQELLVERRQVEAAASLLDRREVAARLFGQPGDGPAQALTFREQGIPFAHVFADR
jgi:hypothetical protein